MTPDPAPIRAPRYGGGWPSIWYTLAKARGAGGLFRMYKALRSKNACKTCAVGMGGQRGGMVNEAGRFPEVCKKSFQAMAADMQGPIAEHFFDDLSLEQLRDFSPRQLEAAGRLTQPLYAGPLDRHYRVIDWEEALRRATDALKKTDPLKSFFYFSGRSSNEAGFLLQLFARIYGTNHVNNCSYYCHQASGVGLGSVTGSGTATVVLEDVDHCDLVFLIGANPSSNHPRLMRSLMEVRRRGGHVVVVNPLKEVGLVRFKVPSDVRSLLFGSTIASTYVQPNIGGDIAFLSGVAKAVLEQGGEDQRFLEQHTEQWPSLREHLTAMPWSDIARQSGVEQAQIESVARCYARSQRTIFAWAMGITHHLHGVDNVRAIGNLALLRGMVGRPGCGLLPIRGHSNVQGIGSMGVTPKLKAAVMERLEQTLQIKLPTEAGLDTLNCLEAADAGRMSLGFCLGGNLFGATPDSTFAARAFSKMDTTIYMSTTLNTGHVHGRGRETLILPVLARDEEPESTTQESMFNYVRLSDGGPARLQGPRSEVQVIAAVAEAVVGDDGPVDFNSLRRHGDIRAAIAKIIPGYEAIGDMDRTKSEFQIAGRTFHEPRFPTESGRARCHVVDLPPRTCNDPDELLLMTIRSEGQFNTVVYEEQDIYRGQERRDVLMMNQQDIDDRGLTVNDPVTVRSATGTLPDLKVRAIDIPPGNAAMYFPEANVLIPKTADRQSWTPAYKSVAVTVIAP